MRVTCKTIEEFIADLSRKIRLFEDETVNNSDLVVGSIVRLSIHRNQESSSRYSVVIQASAVVRIIANLGDEVDDVGEYLLQTGQDCGHDVEAGGGHNEGTEKANRLRDKLKKFCEERGLEVGPGVIEV